MDRKKIFFPIALGLVLLSALFLFSLQQRRTTVVSAAAPPPPYTLYLPLIVRGCNQLIQDGGFEAGLPNAYWQTTSSKSSRILDNLTVPAAHAGAWKAWLGGGNLDTESLWQVFTVPAGTTNLQVSFWWRVSTSEPSPQTFDKLYIRIRNSAGTTDLQTLYTLYDGDASTVWRQSVFVPTLAYAGQTIQLAFVAQTDANNPTSFFIDDVSVQPCQ